MMPLSHGQTQWTRLCQTLKLDPETMTAGDLLAGMVVGGLLFTSDVVHEHDKPRRPRVYVAGPYSQGDVMQNIRAAILAADWLALNDCVPYIPHLSGLWHLVSPHEYPFWLAHDLEWVKVCDALVRLPGPSQGTDGEVVQAQAWGLPVFEARWEGEAVGAPAFLDWLKEWERERTAE